MTAAEIVRLARNPFERLYDALVDPARRERTMVLLLAGYVVAWTLYGFIAKGSQDIHFDMGEMVAWSRDVGFGTPKHPPLAAWLVRAWFSVFPLEDWAYYLFAMISATISLWIAWHVSARYLSPDKRVVGLILLTLVPFYNFHALKFNANTVLIPCWAATTWWFLRSLETRRAGWGILTGIGAAASMLGKYWSIFLLAGLGVAALADPRRGGYFRSPAPWLAIGVGTVLIAPHVMWIFTHNFEPFAYAMGAHQATFASAAQSVLFFLAGTLGYVAAPIVLALVAARPALAAIRDTLWPAEAPRRLVVTAFAAPLLLAALAAVPLRVEIVSLWTMSAMTLLAPVLLSSPLVTITRAAGVRLLVLAIGFPLVMVAFSPAIAIAIHRRGLPTDAAHYRLVAQAVEHAWRERSDKPLRIIGSQLDLANGSDFYFADRPSTFDVLDPALTPWVDDDRIKREGIAIVCPALEIRCVRNMNQYAARYSNATTKDVALARRYFGTLDEPALYRIAIIPPQ